MKTVTVKNNKSKKEKSPKYIWVCILLLISCSQSYVITLSHVPGLHSFILVITVVFLLMTCC